jgi:hypothetical protein
MKKLLSFLGGFFMDDPKSPSMKRLIALYLSVNLGIGLYRDHPMSDTLIYSVTALIATLLGLKVIEKGMEMYMDKKDKDAV